MVCALCAVNCSCSVYVKSQTVLSGLEWKPTLAPSSPPRPAGASAVPFGLVLPGCTGNRAHVVGQVSEGVGRARSLAGRRVPSGALSGQAGGWISASVCLRGQVVELQGFSLQCPVCLVSPSCLFSEV